MWSSSIGICRPFCRGEEVELPYYNFKKGVREYHGNRLKLGEGDILVIEGIHCLNDRLSYSLPKESKFKIYISALTQLNVDEHNRIPTTDGRLLRRMVRDARTRGASAQDTIRMWPSVRKGEEENIFPYQEEADAMFNSALVYELAVLKAVRPAASLSDSQGVGGVSGGQAASQVSGLFYRGEQRGYSEELDSAGVHRRKLPGCMRMRSYSGRA